MHQASVIRYSTIESLPPLDDFGEIESSALTNFNYLLSVAVNESALEPLKNINDNKNNNEVDSSNGSILGAKKVLKRLREDAESLVDNALDQEIRKKNKISYNNSDDDNILNYNISYNENNHAKENAYGSTSVSTSSSTPRPPVLVERIKNFKFRLSFDKPVSNVLPLTRISKQKVKLYCECQTTELEEHDIMVACDNNTCDNGEWFHLSCVSLKKVPEGVWFCKGCAARRSSSKRKMGRKPKYDEDEDASLGSA